MTVLTPAGKPFDWSNPPPQTALALWSRQTSGGARVTGSVRTIAHLDVLDERALKKFGVRIRVIQPPFNRGVKASEGTHDLDACWDLDIPGVPWVEQERFFRFNGCAAWYRKPPTFSPHIHGFSLPPRGFNSVSEDFRDAGMVVGKYVDGGWSTYGRLLASSQIADYYGHRTGLEGHAADNTAHPDDIAATIFNYAAYAKEQRDMKAKDNRVIGLSWNVLTGRKGPEVRRELAALIRANKRPSFVAVQEAITYRGPLSRMAEKLNYRLYQPRHIGDPAPGIQAREAGSTALLIRDDVLVWGSGALRGTHTWEGPKRRLIREGRVFPWVVADIDGEKTLIVAVHMPTGKNNPRNRAAWNESIVMVEALVKEKALPFIILGDWNDPFTSHDPRSPRAMAVRLKGRVASADGVRIDYAVTKGKFTVTKAAKRGSDHYAIRIKKG